MEAITMAEAVNRDFIGAPKIDTNPVNGLKTVRYRIQAANNESGVNCEWSKSFVLTEKQ